MRGQHAGYRPTRGDFELLRLGYGRAEPELVPVMMLRKR